MTQLTTPGFASSTWLVAEREIRMRLRSKAFLISTGILMLAVLASVVIGGLTSQHPTKPHVAAVGTAIAVAQADDVLKVTTVGSVDAAKKLVRSGKVDAAIIPDASAKSPNGIAVIALESAPTEVVSALSITPTVTLLTPPRQNPFLGYIVAVGFGVVFLMSAVTFGGTISQSVVEEKQTRVVEILMSTIPARTLLAGKILGNTLLAFGQIAAIAALAAIGMLASGQDLLLADIGPSLLWFVVFFVFGFVLLAALYSAAAALVSRQEDIGAVTSPIMMLVMIPYFLVIFFNDNSLVLGIMSYVPFSAPIGMPMRLFLGTAQWWEPLLSLAILLVVTAGTTLLGARIYSNSLLRTGTRVKLSEALRGSAR